MLKDMNINEKEKDSQIVKYVNNLLEKNKLIYSNLQNQINVDKKKIYLLQNHNNNIRTERSELEQIFYDCVEEVKNYGSKKILNRTASESILRSADKLKIMEKLVSNKYMLEKIYNLIFNSKFNFIGNTNSKNQKTEHTEIKSKLSVSKPTIKEKETPQKYITNNRNFSLNSGNVIHKSFIVNKGRLLFYNNENKKLGIRGITYPVTNKDL